MPAYVCLVRHNMWRSRGPRLMSQIVLKASLASQLGLEIPCLCLSCVGLQSGHHTHSSPYLSPRDLNSHSQAF